MANIKIIDLPTGSPESTSFIEATQVDEQAASGRASVKLALNALGNYVAGQGASPLEYGDLETESTTLIGAVNELHNTIGADAYDDTATYSEGELCIYNNTLYVCTVSGGITTPEAWTAAHWAATTIEALIATKADASDVSTWEDISNTVSSTSSIEALIYKRNKATGLKFIYFEIKAGTPDNSTLISNLPGIINPVSQAIPVALLNYESIQLGNFSVYYFTDGSVAFRCKTPTSTVKVYASGFIL